MIVTGRMEQHVGRTVPVLLSGSLEQRISAGRQISRGQRYLFYDGWIKQVNHRGPSST